MRTILFLLIVLTIYILFANNILSAQDNVPDGALGCTWGMSQVEAEKALMQRGKLRIAHPEKYPDVLLAGGLNFSGRKVKSAALLFRNDKLYAIRLTVQWSYEEEYAEVRKEFEEQYGKAHENVDFYNIRFDLSEFSELVKKRSGDRKYSSAWKFANGTAVALDIDESMNPTIIYENLSFIESERRARSFGTIESVPGDFCSGPMSSLRVLGTGLCH